MDHQEPAGSSGAGAPGVEPEGSACTRCAICMARLVEARCTGCGAAACPGGHKVLRLISHTSHSRVYLTRSPDGQQVALKELLFTQSPGLREIDAFEREARLLEELSHPRIPRLLAHFHEGEGAALRLYLAQEYISGETLLLRLEQHTFDEQLIREIGLQVLDTLEYLHGRRPCVLHRDIKPSNLIYRPDGALFLVDFGSARESVNGSTHGSTLVGTFGYMPLEQLGGTVSVTSDLYALGATLVHLLGRSPPAVHFHPERGLSLEHLDAPTLRPWLRKLTALRPEERYASARLARRALEESRLAHPGQHPCAVPLREVPDTLAQLAQRANAARTATSESRERQDRQARAVEETATRRRQERWARYEADRLSLADFYRLACLQVSTPSWLFWVGIVLAFLAYLLLSSVRPSALPPLGTREGLKFALVLLLVAYAILGGPPLLRALWWWQQFPRLPFKQLGLGQLLYHTDGDWQKFMRCTLRLTLQAASLGSPESAGRVSATQADMLQLAVHRLNTGLGSIVKHSQYLRQLEWSLQEGEAVGHANCYLGGVLLAFCINQLVPLQRELGLIRAVHLEPSEEWITLPDRY